MTWVRRILVWSIWAIVWFVAGFVPGLLIQRAAQLGTLKGRARKIGVYLASVPDRLLGEAPKARKGR